MKDFYQTNLSILQYRKLEYLLNEPSEYIIKSELSKSGHPIINFRGSYLHSKYDPVIEAQRLINSQQFEDTTTYFIMGLGYGYHVSEILKKLGDAFCVIFIFEVDLDIFNSAFHYADLSFLMDKRVVPLIGKDIIQKFYINVQELSISVIKQPIIFYLQSEYVLFKNKYDELLSRFSEILKQELQNKLTSLEFERLWLKNLISNVQNVSSHQGMSIFYNKLIGYNSLIISAGPSLRKSLESIKKYQNKYFIFVTDTALNTLLEYDIQPDFVVSSDAQYYNYIDFFNLKWKNPPILIYDLKVYPSIVRNVEAYKYFYVAYENNNQIHPFLQWIEETCLLEFPAIHTGTSVSTVCIELARLFGSKHILLVGQDLSYTDRSTHVVNSPVYNDILFYKSNRLKTTESWFNQYLMKRNTVSNDLNPGLKTSFVLQSLKDWLSVYFSIYQKFQDDTINQFINCTENGLSISHIDKISLDQIITSNPSNFPDIQKSDILNQKSFYNKGNSVIIEKINDRYKDLYEVLKRFFSVLIVELERDEIREDNILFFKRKIESEFAFMQKVFEKEDLWYFRKKIIDRESIFIYTNQILRTVEYILKHLSVNSKPI